MIKEKDKYPAPATGKMAQLADIPAGNKGQEADPTDIFTDFPHFCYKRLKHLVAYAKRR